MNRIRASKRLKIQANRETNRASQRSLYRRNSSAARSTKRAQRKCMREVETACYNQNTTTAKSIMVWRASFSLEKLEESIIHVHCAAR